MLLCLANIGDAVTWSPFTTSNPSNKCRIVETDGALVQVPLLEGVLLRVHAKTEKVAFAAHEDATIGQVSRPAATAATAAAAAARAPRAATERAPRAPRAAPRPVQQPEGLAFEVHNAFADLDLPKFMTIIRRENNGASNFKDTNNVLEPIVSYINSSDTALSAEQKTRYMRNIRGSIRENVNMYIRDHPGVKDNILEVIQFILSQDQKYKDLYIEKK